VSDERALRITRTEEKDLRRLYPPIRARVLAALDRLGAEDRSLDIRRLTGSEHFRLRVGDWRVIFDNDHATQTALIRRPPPRQGIRPIAPSVTCDGPGRALTCVDRCAGNAVLRAESR
jgi:mRNA interferase RelE/StbE